MHVLLWFTLGMVMGVTLSALDPKVAGTGYLFVLIIWFADDYIAKMNPPSRGKITNKSLKQRQKELKNNF